jgi:nitric oxide reductase subunit B
MSSAPGNLWLGLAALLIPVVRHVLLWAGTEIFRTAPPMPEKVCRDGQVIYTRADIETGPPGLAEHRRPAAGLDLGPRRAVAPDWSADWLHREAVAMLDLWARAAQHGSSYARWARRQQPALRAR